MTPYARLMQSDQLSEEAKDQLRREFENYDPFELQKGIERKLAAIFRLVRANQKRATQTRQNETQSRRKGAAKTAIAA